MKAETLSLDQAPQLSIPASFFLSIPIGVLLAGAIMVATGSLALVSPWMPQTLALAHAGTLGLLAMGMAGALYQMTPVVAGTPVPVIRLAHAVQLLLLAGLAGFTWRLLGGPAAAMAAAIVCLSLALPAFLLPLGWALLRAATRNETVQGMRLALLSLAAIAVAGLLMARGFAGGPFPANRLLWLQLHLTLALLGWVGGLIVAVSWQVIPMFYLTAAFTRTSMRWLLGLLLAGLLLPLACALLAGGAAAGRVAAIAAAPAALAVWLLHPALILRAVAQRRRKRDDASLLFWKAGLAVALLLTPLAALAVLLPDPRWQILFGWLAIWGWAGLIMHGMLSRIVPFLVWFHRFSPRVGFEPVPSMRSLLSQRRILTGLALHLGSLLCGVAAIFFQADWLARLTGLLLAATAISLAVMLVGVLREGRSRDPERSSRAAG